jgi:hypothetical protein
MEYSADGGQTFSDIMQLSVLTDANQSCIYKWVIPKDSKYASTQAIIKVRDYVLPTVFALTGTFTIQGTTGISKSIVQKENVPQLHVANGRITASGIAGYRVELFDCTGRLIKTVLDEKALAGTMDLGRHSSGTIICRIIKNRGASNPEHILNAKVLTLHH